MRFETYYRLIIRNKKGEIVKDTGLIPSHSYLLQFMQFMYGRFRPISNVNGKDVDGAQTHIVDTSSLNSNRLDAGVGDDTFGLVVGTNAGSTPEANDNYVLDTKILNTAVGEAGKLYYQSVTFVAPTANGGNVDFDITRTWLNETGSPITVKEIGMICKNITDTKYHLLLRDVVSDEVVADGYTLTLVYTLRSTA